MASKNDLLRREEVIEAIGVLGISRTPIESALSDLPVYGKQEIGKYANSEKKKMFAEFWDAYPNKSNRPAAERAFYHIRDLQAKFPMIMTGLKKHIQSEAWKDRNGMYIPFPARWLNQEGWNNPVRSTKPRYGNFDPEEAMQNAIARSFNELEDQK